MDKLDMRLYNLDMRLYNLDMRLYNQIEEINKYHL
jgi:hypothetical protein